MRVIRKSVLSSLLGGILFVSCVSLTRTTASSAATASNSPTTPVCKDLPQPPQPVIEFGRKGGNIRPFLIKINADGQVIPSNPLDNPFEPQLRTDNLAPSTVKAIVQLATANGFWSLPEVIGEKTNPDAASAVVTIRLACTSHSVMLRSGMKNEPFTELYLLLQDLTAEPSIKYRPLG